VADITDLLNAWNSGDAAAREALIPLVYPDIKAIAHNLLRNESSRLTLGSTGLAHEAYLRLVDQKRVQFSGRSHFFGAVSNIMRRVLVDEARKRLSAKRKSGQDHEPLELLLVVAQEPDRNVVALHEALSALEAEHASAAKVVELRYFAGLSLDDIAELHGVTVHAVRREWTFAKAWLIRRLGESS
jgi:RNA polymerase sigma factor (TIGR02999 family)